jgi:hypothetical protein
MLLDGIDLKARRLARFALNRWTSGSSSGISTNA